MLMASRDTRVSCDEELIRFCRTMLERGGVWELWRFIAAAPNANAEQSDAASSP